MIRFKSRQRNKAAAKFLTAPLRRAAKKGEAFAAAKIPGAKKNTD